MINHIFFSFPRGSFYHRRLVNFNPSDRILTTTTENYDEESEEITTEPPDEAKIALEAFNADRKADMKKGHFVHRVQSKRYNEVQKCLNERLKGAQFDYKIYLSCVGCTQCEEKPEQKTEKLEIKMNQTQTKLLKNLEQQKKVLETRIVAKPDADSTEEKMQSEIKRLNSELEKMSDRLQKLTEEKVMLANELMMMHFEKEKKENEEAETEEETESSEINEIEPSPHFIQSTQKTFLSKILSILNKNDDIYDN